MKLTAKIIREKFNPCEKGISNFENNYPGFVGSLEDILCLDNVPYDDKVWLACKIVNIKDLQQWSVECAEYVLDIYEASYPNDFRVRNCIEMTKNYLFGEASLEELNFASDAARAAAWAASAAASAARAARAAASDAARAAASDAASAAARAAASDAASAAASAASDAARAAAWAASDAARAAASDAASDAANDASDAARAAAWAASAASDAAWADRENINLSILIAIVANGDY